LKYHIIPHFHYDLAWVKTEEEYLEIVFGILKSIVEYMEKYPELTYVLDQGYYLEKLKEGKMLPYTNESLKEQQYLLYSKIVSLITEGRIEFVQGGYLAPDLNLVPKRILMHNYMKNYKFAYKEFNKAPIVMWNIDAFGHHGYMPQIARKVGCKYYIIWRGVPKDIPMQFIWKGHDNITIPTVRLPYGYSIFSIYQASLDKAIEYLKPYSKQGLLIPMGCDFAYPNEELIKQVLYNKDAIFSTPTKYFESIEWNKVPTIKQEFFVRDNPYCPPLIDCWSSRTELKRLFRARENNIKYSIDDLIYCSMHDIICLPQNQYILFNDVFIPIEKITSGLKDKDGNIVLETYERYYDGEIISIKPHYLEEKQFTPNHPILLAKRIRPYESIKGKNHLTFKCFAKPIFIRADKARKGDAVLIPKDRIFKKQYIFPFNYSKRTYCLLPKSKLEVDEEIGELIGWFTAEGSASLKGGVSFTLGLKEISEARRIQYLLKKKFNLNSKLSKRSSTITVRSGSTIFARFLRSEIGSNASNKRIPPWIFNNELKVIIAYLNALFKGDGTVYRGVQFFSTVSKELALQTQQLLLKIGIVSSFSSILPKQQRKDKYKIFGKLRIYSLAYTINRKHFRYLEDDKYFYFPIYRVRHLNWQGKVYNLKTLTGTFKVPFIVHNCGTGIDPIYHKVKEKLKYQEWKEEINKELDNLNYKHDSDLFNRIYVVRQPDAGDSYYFRQIKNINPIPIKYKISLIKEEKENKIETKVYLKINNIPNHRIILIIKTNESNGILIDKIPGGEIERTLDTWHCSNGYFKYNNWLIKEYGTPQHLVTKEGEIYIILSRSISLLSWGDAGPILSTPEALELGEHIYKFKVVRKL